MGPGRAQVTRTEGYDHHHSSGAGLICPDCPSDVVKSGINTESSQEVGISYFMESGMKMENSRQTSMTDAGNAQAAIIRCLI